MNFEKKMLGFSHHNRLFLLKLVVVGIISISCQQKESRAISLQTLLLAMDMGVPVVDIRTDKEYKAGHIKGAINIDFYSKNFIKQMKQFGEKEKIVIHCASGGRSGAAVNVLVENGFSKVLDYSGGFTEWKESGQPVEHP